MNTDKLAYVLATAHWETRWYHLYEQFEGNDERLYFENKYGYNTNIGKQLGNENEGDGYAYRGRGFAHITGRANYKKFGYENDPDQAANPQNAARDIVVGMKNGSFRNHKLADYNLPENEYDFIKAREIINDSDLENLFQGVLPREPIATVAKGFAEILSEGCKTNSVPCEIQCR